MRILTVLLCLFLFCQKSSAQKSNIDSLDREIAKATTDTAKIRLECRKVSTWSRLNLDSAISQAERTLPKAKQTDFTEARLFLQFNLATNYSYTVRLFRISLSVFVFLHLLCWVFGCLVTVRKTATSN